MATELQSLVVSLEASITKYERTMQKALGQTQKTTKKMEDAFARTSQNIGDQFSAIGMKMTAGLGVGLMVRELSSLASTWTDLTSRVNIAAGSLDKGEAVMQRLSEMADRTYSSLEQTAESWLQNATSLREMGYSTQQQLDLTEALNNALVISGTRGQRATMVMDAWSKAMALGQLSGQNLNTIIQSGGRVTEALAKSMGVSTNELRKLGAEGKITTKVMYGITKEQEKLREEAANMPATIEDGFVRLRSALLRYIGTADSAAGVSSSIAAVMIGLSDNFEHVGNAAATAAALMLARYAPALIRVTALQVAAVATNPFLLTATAITGAALALSKFGDQIKPIEGEMANLQHYAGAVWDAVSDGVVVASGAINDALLGAINLLTQAMGGVEVKWADIGEAFKTAGNKLISELKYIYDVGLVTFSKLPQAVADKSIEAMNGLVKFVESSINQIIRGINKAIEAINTIPNALGSSSRIDLLGNVNLGQIYNKYAGAGKEAADAYKKAMADSLRKDDVIGAAFEDLRKRANERAARTKNKANLDDAAGGGAASAAAGATSGAAGSRDVFARAITQAERRTAVLEAENKVIGEGTAARERAKMVADLETAAKAANTAAGLKNTEVTAKQREQIDAVADAMYRAAAAAEAANSPLARYAREAAAVGDMLENAAVSGVRSMEDALIDVVMKTKNASAAFKNMANAIIADLARIAIRRSITGPIAGMLGGGGGSSLFNPLAGAFSFGYAAGGYISGPGGPRSDSIPARLSNGEYVVNARATAQHRDLLDAINFGKGFAAGGYVGMPKLAGRGVGTKAAAPIQVNVYNESQTASADARPNGSGGMDIVVRDMVRGVISDDVRSAGPISKMIAGGQRGYGGR